MAYAAVVLSVLGIMVGATFRLRFLLGMILSVLFISMIFAWSSAHNLKEAMLIIVAAQIILQSGYFVGLMSRPFLSRLKLKLLGFFGSARHLQQDRDI
jgi:hypothetical protein